MKETQLFTKSELSPSVYKELLPLFFEEINDDFTSLKQAFLVKDLAEVKRLTHKIKGCSISYSAVQIFEKASTLQAAGANEDLDSMKDAIHELEKTINLSYSFSQKEFQID